jgi:cell division protein FtsB
MPVTTLKRAAVPKRESAKVARSQTERLWLIGGALVAFVLLLIGFFFFISPQRSQTSDVNSQVASTEQHNAQLEARLNTLRTQNKNLAKYKADLATARLALPATSGISDFLRTLQSLGNSTQTQVTAVTVGQPAPVVAAVATSSTGSPSSPAPTPTSASATGAPGATTGLQVYSLAITANVSGGTDALNKFVEQLQAVQPRAVLITQITEGSGVAATGSQAAAATTTLQLTMQAFVAPATPAPAASPSTPTH